MARSFTEVLENFFIKKLKKQQKLAIKMTPPFFSVNLQLYSVILRVHFYDF